MSYQHLGHRAKRQREARLRQAPLLWQRPPRPRCCCEALPRPAPSSAAAGWCGRPRPAEPPRPSPLPLRAPVPAAASRLRRQAPRRAPQHRRHAAPAQRWCASRRPLPAACSRLRRASLPAEQCSVQPATTSKPPTEYRHSSATWAVERAETRVRLRIVLEDAGPSLGISSSVSPRRARVHLHQVRGLPSRAD